MALCGAGLSWLLTVTDLNVSAHFAASHQYSAACTHPSILVSLPFPSDAPSPTALTRWPKMIYLIRPPRVHPGSRHIFLKPSEAYSTKAALYLNLSHSLVRPELRSGYQLQYPSFVCLFLSFYTPPSSCLLGAPCDSPVAAVDRLPHAPGALERDSDDFWKSPAVQFIEASYRHPRQVSYSILSLHIPTLTTLCKHLSTTHPLLCTRRSYNDGPGLTPHRLHGDAARKSVVATGLYLLESPRAADLKRARLLTDPWGARARAGAATPYMSVDVEKVTSVFQTL
ncbi:hypothetical protein C8J57DRAFT_1502379 [Mycena rebaudengoi]|nr:hypothetical protein C8J57DRAFT_1502379 [Mycena rebaudengoi]